MLTSTARRLDAFKHPRVSVAWQDLDLVYRKVFNQSSDITVNLVGKRLADVLDDPDEVRRLEAAKLKILKTGKPHHETFSTTIAGNRHIFDVSIEPTYDAGGKLDGLISISIEITDLVSAREQLKEANNRLMKLLDQTLASPNQRTPLRRRD
jgi:hypothetical protein